MKEDRFTELDKDDHKRFIPCKQYKWLDDMDEEYSEYKFFIEKFRHNKEVKYIETRDMVYTIASDYIYKDIKFTMVVDLDYESVDFLVEDIEKVEIIREFVERTIKDSLS